MKTHFHKLIRFFSNLGQFESVFSRQVTARNGGTHDTNKRYLRRLHAMGLVNKTKKYGDTKSIWRKSRRLVSLARKGKLGDIHRTVS